MSIEIKNETECIFVYPSGEYNEEIDVEITDEGIELDGYSTILWEWIDNARKVVEGKAMSEEIIFKRYQCGDCAMGKPCVLKVPFDNVLTRKPTQCPFIPCKASWKELPKNTDILKEEESNGKNE